MRIQLHYIMLLFSLAACTDRVVEKPVWLNKTSTVQMPDAALQFASAEKNYNAALQGFTQPIPLHLSYHDSGFVIQLQNKKGVTEGPAILMLNHGKKYFYYDLLLVNKQIIATSKDYRSPKTVNPDSSLQQQRIVHQIDGSRNIVAADNIYFKEEIITLSPKVGIYRAIASEPLTAYYVQAGSCVNINVESTYNKEKELFTVTAGPLKDKYDNTVADGTLVAFIYSDEEQTWRMESSLLDGVATVFIPADKKYTLHAKVNETISNTITLIP